MFVKSFVFCGRPEVSPNPDAEASFTDTMQSGRARASQRAAAAGSDATISVLHMSQMAYLRHSFSTNCYDLVWFGLQCFTYLFLYLHPDGFNFRHAIRVKHVCSTPLSQFPEVPNFLRGHLSR